MFSFICSSNNNIPRITKMLSSFREKYGEFLMEIPTRMNGHDDEDGTSACIGCISLFSFPTLSSLVRATEDELRAMGLGYRARYILATRDLLLERGGEDHLMKLRSMQDAQAVQDELIKFSGIGRKVADCIALFSLDQDDAIPVDVHVQHIASRDYDPTVFDGAKSITPTVYKKVGDLFRDRFQTYAGWAHSLLFVAELPSFRAVLPPDLLYEMDEVSFLYNLMISFLFLRTKSNYLNQFFHIIFDSGVNTKDRRRLRQRNNDAGNLAKPIRYYLFSKV